MWSWAHLPPSKGLLSTGYTNLFVQYMIYYQQNVICKSDSLTLLISVSSRPCQALRSILFSRFSIIISFWISSLLHRCMYLQFVRQFTIVSLYGKFPPKKFSIDVGFYPQSNKLFSIASKIYKIRREKYLWIYYCLWKQNPKTRPRVAC